MQPEKLSYYREPKLLAVSIGTVSTNQEWISNHPLYLIMALNIGHAIGVSGTPSAVLIDATGIIVSDLAVGTPVF